MPVFFHHRVMFIHIPKCGGDTVSHILRESGDPPFLFVADGSVKVNGHTPQHMTWRELQDAGWNKENPFRVCTLVRHPIDRVISAFQYIFASRPDLKPIAQSTTTFLRKFLSSDPLGTACFDNHNLPIHEFLEGRDGKIDPIIEIWPVQKMDEFMETLGLPPVPVGARRNVTAGSREHNSEMRFSEQEIMEIAQHYSRDIKWFNENFPNIKSEYSE